MSWARHVLDTGSYPIKKKSRSIKEELYSEGLLQRRKGIFSGGEEEYYNRNTAVAMRPMSPRVKYKDFSFIRRSKKTGKNLGGSMG